MTNSLSGKGRRVEAEEARFPPTSILDSFGLITPDQSVVETEETPKTKRLVHFYLIHVASLASSFHHTFFY